MAKTKAPGNQALKLLDNMRARVREDKRPRLKHANCDDLPEGTRIRRFTPEVSFALWQQLKSLGVEKPDDVKSVSGDSPKSKALRHQCVRVIQRALCSAERTSLAYAGEEGFAELTSALSDESVAQLTRDVLEFDLLTR